MREPIENLLPERVGKWKILRESPIDYIDHNARKWRMVECLCDCGDVRTISLANLTRGKSKGCKSCNKGGRPKKN